MSEEEDFSYADVIDWLHEKIGYLEGQFRKPGHGNCCTCQDCGQNHDDCVCMDLEYFRYLHKIVTKYCVG